MADAPTAQVAPTGTLRAVINLGNPVLAQGTAQEHVALTAPYVVIEGVYVVAGDSPLSSADEVDRDGVRIGVRECSALNLFLTHSLEHAEVVRADEATDVFEEQRLEAAAGIRQPMEEYVATTGREMTGNDESRGPAGPRLRSARP